jgi:hypothetical protein
MRLRGRLREPIGAAARSFLGVVRSAGRRRWPWRVASGVSPAARLPMTRGNNLSRLSCVRLHSAGSGLRHVRRVDLARAQPERWWSPGRPLARSSSLSENYYCLPGGRAALANCESRDENDDQNSSAVVDLNRQAAPPPLLLLLVSVAVGRFVVAQAAARLAARFFPLAGWPKWRSELALQPFPEWASCSSRRVFPVNLSAASAAPHKLAQTHTHTSCRLPSSVRWHEWAGKPTSGAAKTARLLSPQLPPGRSSQSEARPQQPVVRRPLSLVSHARPAARPHPHQHTTSTTAAASSARPPEPRRV